MLRKSIMAIGFMAISGIAYSQGQDFKGPQAKNYKAWQHSVETTEVAIVSDQEDLKRGPQAKNKINRLLNSASSEGEVAITTSKVINNPRLGLVGPRAKNTR